MKYTYLILVLLFSQLLIAQRDVHWTHGLGEEDNDMTFYRDFVRNNYSGINQRIFEYNDAGAISAAPSSLRTPFGGLPANRRTIAIGHSMGGLVWRETARTMSDKIGGIITVGTPNQGAPIVEALANGTVERVVQSGCKDLAAAPVGKTLALIPILNKFAFLKPLAGNLATNFACNNLYSILDMVDGSIGSTINNLKTAPPYRDMNPNSSFMQALNATPATIPIVSVVGEESNSEHWRVLSTQVSQSISKGVSGNDQEVLNTVNKLRGVYNAFYIYNLSKTVISGISGFFNPVSWFQTVRYAILAHYWKRGVNWFDRSETVWENLIGSRDVLVQETRTFTYQSTNCNLAGFTGSQAWINCIRNCNAFSNGCPLVTSTYTVSVRRNFPNDGILSTYHQSLPGQKDEDIYRGRGINHFEQLDGRGSSFKRPGVNDEMEATYREIFDSPITDFFFKLEKK